MKSLLDLDIGLSDKQIEFEESLNGFNVTGYGGGKGGGKSFSGRMIPILRSLEKPGHVGALFRRSYPELEDNHIGPLFRAYPQLRDYYNGSTHSIRFPWNESVFQFRYCRNLTDVDSHAGREYHTLIIEEAGDWMYEMAIRLIRNSNRSSAPGIKATAALMFNWGGVGHGWLRRIFVKKELRENEKHLTWNFILALVRDNPKLLENDPDYLKRLQAEPNEALRRAHIDGDSEIIAGQYFEIVDGVHIIDSFPTPKHWVRFGSYDYGYNHLAVFLWHAADEDGNIYTYRELALHKNSIADQKRKVWEYPEDTKLIPSWQAGHDVFAVKKAGDPTIAEDFLNPNIGGKALVLKAANINRKLGASQIRTRFRYEYVKTEKGSVRIGPVAFITKDCPILIDCMRRMIHNPKDPEDVLKVDSENGDVSTGDDPYDCYRYGTMSRPIPTPKSRVPSKDRYGRERSNRPSAWTI